MKRIYGWRPDKPDFRDHVYSEVIKSASLPSSVDLRPLCPPVQDQGELGSCTGNAIASALEFLEKLNNVPKFFDYSRLFIYYNERVIENTVSSDAGAEIRDGIKSINRWGCCSEASWPYNIAKFRRKPSVSAYKQARQNIFKKYERLSSVDQYQSCLANKHPFVFGFTVYESFESDVVARTGVVPMPGPNESVLGGHAVLGVGYDNASKRFLVMNSWGTGWGMGGFCTIPYDYLGNSNLADDFWVVRG